MSSLLLLIPLALITGVFWLVLFIWSLKSGQYDDLEGASYRILNEDEPQNPEESKRQTESF